MKKCSSMTLCETEAVRIQYWFGKDKENLLTYLLNQKSLKSRRYTFVRTPHIPSQENHFSLQNPRSFKKKTPPKERLITVEKNSTRLQLGLQPTQCSVNQKYPHALSGGSKLNPERIIRWHLKGHFFVSKKLKTLAKQTCAGHKRHKVVPIRCTPQDEGSKVYLEELFKNTEERQFKMERVIKF